MKKTIGISLGLLVLFSILLYFILATAKSIPFFLTANG